jgi:formylglycine-generating enzyme required for sulfatase activity
MKLPADRQPLNRKGFITCLSALALTPSGEVRASLLAGQTARKFALVIANYKYEKNPLPNIDNDAALMGQVLREIGFEITTVQNGTRTVLRDAIRSFSAKLMSNPGSLVVIYYSGHGVQVDGQNYLVPVNNAALLSEADVKEDCLSLSYVLDSGKQTKAKSYIVIVDACRDNPFLGQKGDGGKGLTPLAASVDPTTLVAFAASPGETASANPSGKYSLYTQELAKNLRVPGVSIQDVFTRTRASVRMLSNGKQRPREDNGLEETMILNGPVGKSSTAVANPSLNETKNVVELLITNAPVGTKLAINGVAIQGTRFTQAIMSATAKVEVTAVADGFLPFVKSIELTAGLPETISVNMVPIPAKIKVGQSLSKYPVLAQTIERACSIPAGSFLMGRYSNLFEGDQKPVHSVTLDAFKCTASVVTVELWREYASATGRGMPSVPSWGWIDGHPIVNISWMDICGTKSQIGFLQWASDVTGIKCSLPTEAEWEYACRSGKQSLDYPWGDVFDPALVWHSLNSDGDRLSTGSTTRISIVYTNKFGLVDMIGNVRQWTADNYGPYFPDAVRNPTGRLQMCSRLLLEATIIGTVSKFVSGNHGP